MTTAYTSLLGLALPVTGELSGTWGTTVNDAITSLLDSAVAGTTTISSDADVTLTTTTGAANTSRQVILLWTAGGTVTRNITAPAQSKTYIVINKSSSTQSIVLRGVGPTTGVTIIKGEAAVCAWNGTDFIKVSNISGPGTFTDLTVTGNTSLGDADTDTITQAASYVTGTQLKSAKTATNTLNLAAYDTDGAAYTNLVTLTASTTPTLALTSTGVGTINNMSVGATTASTGSFTSITDSGNLTFTGTGNRITGDFSNATFANRVAFQTSTTNGNTLVAAIPNGTSTTSGLWAFNNSDLTNAGRARITAGSTEISFTSDYNGTGTYLPMTFSTGGGEKVRIVGGTGSDVGFVGIGTSSPAYKLDVAQNSAANNFIGRFINTDTGSSSGAAVLVTQGNVTGQFQAYGNAAINFGTQTNHPIVIQTNTTERIRIDTAGNMFLGRTSAIVTGRFCVQNTAGSNTIETIQSGSGGYNYYSDAASNGGSYYHATFTEANTQRGSIVSNGSVTLYNTTSDQRLKENIVNAPEFGDVIDALQVRSFDWKSNQKHQRAGFIAQELVTVAPEAVHHPVNEEEMMAVDYSKLVPMLVKEIQSLRKRIAALELT